jgi:phage replication-related protein YjqB (UPF0714/DUF867 family)
VTVHGYGRTDEIMLIGGRDVALRRAIGDAARAAGVACEDAPPGLDGADRNNLCNRGRTGAGIQLEISLGLRRAARRSLLIRAVREVLLAA